MSEMQTIVLAIDCGSTNLKAALFDAALNRIAEVSAPVEYLHNDLHTVEMDVEVIWSATVRLIQQACRNAGVAPAAITHVAPASQAQTFALLDAEGKALTPLISWLDQRGREESDQLQAAVGEHMHQYCSFAEMTPQMQLPKLLWIRHRLGARFDDAAQVVSMPGLLMLRLTGRNLLDRNLAAMNGLLSLQDNDWWSAALDAAKVPGGLLPKLVDVGAAVSAQAACGELGMDQPLTLAPAGNDQTSGAYAVDVHKGRLLATLGTALVAYRYVGADTGPYCRQGCWGPYPDGGYYELICREGCSSLDWARKDLFGSDSDIAVFAQAADDAGPRRSDQPEVCFYPQHVPGDGAWLGGAGLPQRARAVMEGVTFALKEMLVDDMQLADAPRKLAVTGGGSRNATWMQMIADIVGCPVSAVEADCLLGAAKMAIPNIAPPTSEASPVLPTPGRTDLYRRAYRYWQEHTPGPSVR